MQGVLLFDIDGVIRDVTNSYRLAIKETVYHFVYLRPSTESIDNLKSEGCWNNDWDASIELIRRMKRTHCLDTKIPPKRELIEVFNSFYFGGDPEGDPQYWNGFIKNEPLLVKRSFFDGLNKNGISWGFVSGAEPSSAKYVLETRLGLSDPPLIAMGDAPEKPNPEGLVHLATRLLGNRLGRGVPPIAYLGDTVADIVTIKKAKELLPNQIFLSLGVAPPHLHNKKNQIDRSLYEAKLLEAGANQILNCTEEILDYLNDYFQ